MSNKNEILKKRFSKLQKHYAALKEYKNFINRMVAQKNIYKPSVFNSLSTEEKAVLDAYLKRFASVQDFLGSKIFPVILEIAGIDNSKMSEVLYNVEREGIIDSLENWIELREIRNELEHDYPEKLQEALSDLKFCIDNYIKIESYYLNAIKFAGKHLS